MSPLLDWKGQKSLCSLLSDAPPPAAGTEPDLINIRGSMSRLCKFGAVCKNYHQNFALKGKTWVFPISKSPKFDIVRDTL